MTPEEELAASEKRAQELERELQRVRQDFDPQHPSRLDSRLQEQEARIQAQEAVIVELKADLEERRRTPEPIEPPTPEPEPEPEPEPIEPKKEKRRGWL